MYRQSPSRNQRSKGIKIKHVLQICLLLAVCFWLIYQVKHSHDKKKEFDESDAKLQRGDEIVKLGRKDVLDPKVEVVTKAVVEEEETNAEDVDESEDKRVEAKEDETDAEEDNEAQEVDTEDGSSRGESEEKEDNDHDGDNQSVREEHYKADDASSAVTHDNENERVDSSTEGLLNVTASENPSPLNNTVTEALNGSPPNNTVTEGSSQNLPEAISSNGADNSTDISNDSDENMESLTEGENVEEVQHDTIDESDTTSNMIEEKDLDTLPEIQTEGTNSKDVAAE